jgi:putative Mg2+ transporter-C (MgtC) family protein
MNVDLEMALRLLLATFLGAIIGLQRELSGKEAGIRTHILISLGSGLFTVLSIYGFLGSDPARVASGVAAGIGFIGAGVILHRSGGIVTGLTTAATIWAVAGIGMAAGAGLYIVSAVATALTLMILMLPHFHRRGN